MQILSRLFTAKSDPYIAFEYIVILLIDCAKHGNPRITVDSPLIVYNKDGSYTDEILSDIWR